MNNEEAYKEIVNLLKQNGDKRYIAMEDWADECEGNDGDGTDVSIFGIGLDDDDDICVAAVVDNIGYGHGPDDFPQEWTKATELWKPNYCDFHRFVSKHIEQAMTKQKADKVAKYYWYDDNEAEEESGVPVILTSPGTAKLQIIKLIMKVCGLDLNTAKKLVDKVPTVIKKCDNLDEARDLIKAIGEIGGEASY